MQGSVLPMALTRYEDLFPLWVERLAVHQDYGWFVSMVAWSWVLLVWWRHPRRMEDWGWLPYIAVAAVLAAVVQFMIYDPTFDWFQERLIPGTTNQYAPAVIAVELLGDFLLTCNWMVLAGVWAWVGATQRSQTGWRWGGVGLAGLAATATIGQPEWGTAVLAVIAVVAASWIRPKVGAGRNLIWLAALIPVASTVGPLAFWGGGMQRVAAATPWGLIAALVQVGVAVVFLRSMWGDAMAVRAGGNPQTNRQEFNVFCIVAALWTLIGLSYAELVGSDNRRELQTNRLRTMAAEVKSFDPRLLAPLVGGGGLPLEWKSVERDRVEPTAPRAEVLQSPAANDLRRELARIVKTTPFLDRARVLMVQDGWLMELATDRLPRDPSEVVLLRRATLDDEREWANPRPYIETDLVPEIGAEYYCRAPILTPDGQMLGWLDFVREEFFQSLERKWRAGPLMIVALGLVAAALVAMQRRSLRERELAWKEAVLEAEANKLKTTFLAKVSHELRTPLQALLGYSELLERDARDDAEKGRLSRLRDQGQLLLRLVNDLLDLSAMEATGLRLVVAPLELNRLVERAVDDLRPQAEIKGLRLNFEADPGLAQVWHDGDAIRLRQVVYNLVGNAVKYTVQGSVRVHLVARSPGDLGELRLSVEDTGPGVPRDQQATLFQPFTRLAETRAAEGSGMGLAMVAALAKAMGGRATVDSDGVAGSVFGVDLSLAVVNAPAFKRDGAGTPEISLGGKRVLIAEDNLLVQELFNSVLSEAGAVCTVAADGETAVHLLLATPFDAVVLDLNLPVLDGFEVARRLRAPGVWSRSLRIVGVSAHASGEDAQNARKAGMDEFLTKPVELTVLIRALAGEPSSKSGTESGPSRMASRLHQMFRDDVPAQRDALRQALEEGDAVRLRRQAHYLANSASAVGDRDLLLACRDLEAHVAEADQARSHWERVEGALRRWID
jgi:signal transduction histidine kinase/CheY-like chemotaxis protein